MLLGEDLKAKKKINMFNASNFEELSKLTFLNDSNVARICHRVFTLGLSRPVSSSLPPLDKKTKGAFLRG